MSLPAYPSVAEIQTRLQNIFPVGTQNRSDCVNPAAARAVFVMLYVGAIEGADVWVRPDQVTRMTDGQAAKDTDADRIAWRTQSTKSGKGDIPGRWYAGNTRESIRDDTLRMALIPNGAVVTREVATTSNLGRYALRADFAALFSPLLTGDPLEAAMTKWRADHLTPAALAKIALIQQGAADTGEPVLVKLPNGETRRMSKGPSSAISKAVIEAFAPTFLAQPAVLWLSESAKKVYHRDDALAKSIGLKIDPERVLPDIILVDVGGTHARLIFVEVVHSDGPVTDVRKNALLTYAAEAGFTPDHVSFVTAYAHRGHAAFKKTVPMLAWGAYAWFMNEPDKLLLLSDKAGPID